MTKWLPQQLVTRDPASQAFLQYLASLEREIAAGGGGGGTDLGYTAATRILTSSTGADVTSLPLVSSSDAGLAPASGGGTSNFLRADGTWAAPAGGASPAIAWVI